MMHVSRSVSSDQGKLKLSVLSKPPPPQRQCLFLIWKTLLMSREYTKQVYRGQYPGSVGDLVEALLWADQNDLY